jgi:hypothetical protein
MEQVIDAAGHDAKVPSVSFLMDFVDRVVKLARIS